MKLAMRLNTRLFSFLVFIATLLILVSLSCSLFDRLRSPIQMCTLIGCQDSFVVDLTDDIPDNFTLEAVGPDGESRTVRCVDGRKQEQSPGLQESRTVCLDKTIFLYDFTPEQVTLTVTWQNGQLTQMFDPVYSTFQPNGRGCPPKCRTAHVEVKFP